MNRITRRGHERGVAGTEQRQHEVRERLLGPDGGAHLRLGVDGDVEAPVVEMAQRLAQLGNAACHRIAVVARITCGLDELRHRRVGRRKVGIAEAEVDHVLACSPVLHLQRVDGRERIRRQRIDPSEVPRTKGYAVVTWHPKQFHAYLDDYAARRKRATGRVPATSTLRTKEGHLSTAHRVSRSPPAMLNRSAPCLPTDRVRSHSSQHLSKRSQAERVSTTHPATRSRVVECVRLCSLSSTTGSTCTRPAPHPLPRRSRLPMHRDRTRKARFARSHLMRWNCSSAQHVACRCDGSDSSRRSPKPDDDRVRCWGSNGRSLGSSTHRRTSSCRRPRRTGTGDASHRTADVGGVHGGPLRATATRQGWCSSHLPTPTVSLRVPDVLHVSERAVAEVHRTTRCVARRRTPSVPSHEGHAHACGRRTDSHGSAFSWATHP